MAIVISRAWSIIVNYGSTISPKNVNYKPFKIKMDVSIEETLTCLSVIKFINNTLTIPNFHLRFHELMYNIKIFFLWIAQNIGPTTFFYQVRIGCWWLIPTLVMFSIISPSILVIEHVNLNKYLFFSEVVSWLCFLTKLSLRKGPLEIDT